MFVHPLSLFAGLLVLAGPDAPAVPPVEAPVVAEAPVAAEAPVVAEAPAWSEMLAAVNEVRAAGATCGDVWHPPAEALVWDGRLAAAAERHSRDMSRNGHFEHHGTDGRDVGERADGAGYDWRALGENIARRQVSVEQVMGDWLESPAHCRQLLSPDYLELGAAKVGSYWTQMFGAARG